MCRRKKKKKFFFLFKRVTSTRQRVFKSTDDDANDKFYLEAKGLHDDWLKAFENPPLSLHAPLLSDRESAKPQKTQHIDVGVARLVPFQRIDRFVHSFQHHERRFLADLSICASPDGVVAGKKQRRHNEPKGATTLYYASCA